MRQIYSGFLKPLLDKLTALLVLIIISPLMLIIAISLYFKHGEVIFRQQRPGFKGETFTIFKFASLDSDHVADSALRRFIRATHFNETLQLLNILKGNMSWVGPRPLLLEYMPYYSMKQNERHDVKPGIFGLAQLKETELKSWEEKFNMDLDYVERQSFSLDLKILLLSIKQALSGKLFDRAGTLKRFSEN
ncbi:MAG: sugar transferase [Cytophagales bacterium]